MINNVVDHRSNKYNVNVDVAFEPSCQDNSIEGATQFPWASKSFAYDELLNTTIVQAIEHAQKYDCPVTMYLYDVGEMTWN